MSLIHGSYPNVTYLDEYITDGNKAVLSLHNFYETLKIEDANTGDAFRTPWNDFFLKYRKELNDIEEWKSLPESLYYRPKSVSLDLYGTTELWIALLRVNNMKNITEFHYPIIKIYRPQDLMELINIYFKRNKIIT